MSKVSKESVDTLETLSNVIVQPFQNCRQLESIVEVQCCEIEGKNNLGGFTFQRKGENLSSSDSDEPVDKKQMTVGPGDLSENEGTVS
jgi:hypothetical protein